LSFSQVRRRQARAQLSTKGPTERSPQDPSPRSPQRPLEGSSQGPPQKPTECVIEAEGLNRKTTKRKPNHEPPTRRPSIRRLTFECPKEAPAVAKQPQQEPKKSHARRRANQSQVPETDVPLRTRGALGKRLKQYGYGLYTDERSGTVILNVSFISLLGCI